MNQSENCLKGSTSHIFALLATDLISICGIIMINVEARDYAMPMKTFPKIMGWAALLVWLGSIYLFLQYDATRPTMPQPAQGRIYSSNNHVIHEKNYAEG